MVSLEQVKLLESKVIKAVEYVDQVTEENGLLREKLESYQKRIDELEVLVRRFKEDQGQIEEGIISALNRLSQFEADIEKSLSPEKAVRKEAAHPPEAAGVKEEEVKSAGQDMSGEPPPEEAEEENGGGLILEPETDDLSGDEENSEDTLGPGELDIF
jgi:septal ring factor EnvC (AmiA/AmiB activator)